MQIREQCSRRGCRNKPWSNHTGELVCHRHAGEIFSRSGVPTRFDRSTFICERNNMRFEDMAANVGDLRRHWQDCPPECDVNSCPRLEGIPRAGRQNEPTK